MPNWNQNILKVADCSPELESYLKENGLSFEKIKPTPPELLNDTTDGWYSWRLENWGTKWDLEEQEQHKVADQLIDFQAQFTTAWSPPLEAIKALSEMFPHDEFTLDYFEEGCWFAGTAIFSEGEIDHRVVDDADVLEFAKENFDFIEYEEEKEIPADV